MAILDQFEWALDDVTQALPNKSGKLTEVLKQPQYASFPTEKQILVIYTTLIGFVIECLHKQAN